MAMMADEFLPAPRYEQHGGAAFWPDTFFVDMNAAPAVWMARITDEQVDPDTGGLRHEFITTDMVVASGTLMHERMHWLQAIGTSFGYLMSRLRILRGELAMCTLATCPQDQRGRLFELRSRGRAIAARGADGQLLHDHGYSGTVQSLLDHWWATVAVDRFLVDGRAPLLGSLPPDFLVGMVLRYLLAGDDIRSVFESPDIDFVKWCRDLGPTGAVPDALKSDGFTVRHIEEGAAVAAQVLFLNRMAEAETGLGRTAESTTIRAAANTLLAGYRERGDRLYLEAFDRMALAVPDQDRAGRRWLEDFLLVCDIALNPLLIRNGSPVAMMWSDWHPVLRFEKLLNAASRLRYPWYGRWNPAKPGWWSKRRAKLLQESGLAEQREPMSLGSETRRGAPSQSPIMYPASHARYFVARAHADAMRARAIPAFMSSPGDAMCDAPDEILTLTRQNALCFDCPLVIIGTEGHHYGIDEREYVSLLFALFDLRIAHWSLASAGAIDFGGLPADETALLVRSNVLERFKRTFGAPVM